MAHIVLVLDKRDGQPPLTLGDVVAGKPFSVRVTGIQTVADLNGVDLVGVVGLLGTNHASGLDREIKERLRARYGEPELS